MFFDRRIAELTLCGLSIMSTSFLCACEEDSSVVPNHEDRYLNVEARIAKEVYTRDSNEGIVTSGTYYLSYPTDYSYSVAAVNFGFDPVNPQIGYVETSDGQQFTWDRVKSSNNTSVFYLDNVAPPPPSPGQDPLVVIFNDDNIFKAGIYDSTTFKNDLLWGTKTVQRNTTGNQAEPNGTIHFDLHHNMSRVRVMVTADNTYEHDGSLDLEGALVQISNVNLNPVSFNRADGMLTLEDSPENFGPITLVNEQSDISEEYIKWSSSWKNDEGFPTYISHSCIVPPQMLAEDDTRSRLTITLQNGSSFSGIIPHAMEIDPPAYSETTNPYPVTFSFLKEHLITIRTVISENPPSLAFMPVKVVEWVDKGKFDYVAHQAGIYTADEFFRMIEYYRADNKYQLQRYGPFNAETNEWNFNFFSSIVIKVDSIEDLFGQMQPDDDKNNDYSFIFNGYSVYIKEGTKDPVAVTEVELYKILAGKS